MGEYRENESFSKKRARDDSDDTWFNPPESKLARVGSDNAVVNSFQSIELSRVDSDDSVVNSPEAKRIQDDLFSILDDSDPDPAIQGLDSVIRSFEEEILVPPPSASVTQVSGESQPELGYLLEASDDELGLPPSLSSGDERQNTSPVVDLTPSGSGTAGLEGVMLGFEDEIPSYDSFGFGIVGDSMNNSNNNSSDVLTLGDGLFDYSDESFEPADFSESSWRHESLSAL